MCRADMSPAGHGTKVDPGVEQTNPIPGNYDGECGKTAFPSSKKQLRQRVSQGYPDPVPSEPTTKNRLFMTNYPSP